MTETTVTSDHISDLLAANYPDAVLAYSVNLIDEYGIVARTTAETRGYTILVAAADVRQTWGEGAMTDDELAICAQEYNTNLRSTTVHNEIGNPMCTVGICGH